MWANFFLENTHFAINFFAAFVFFAIYWLYWDAWRQTPRKRDFFRLSGFLLLAISFVFEASQIEATLLPTGSTMSSFINIALVVTRILGYFFVLVGMVSDPLPKHPNTSGNRWGVPAFAFGFSYTNLFFVFPVLAASVAFMYLRRATLGLERHMRAAAIGYFFLSVAHVFGLAFLFQGSGNASFYGLVAPFGPLWILENLFVVLGVCFLAYWVWQYLLTRVQTKLFIVFVSLVVVIFLVTVTIFTALLLNNMRGVTLTQLASDNKVLNLSLDGKKAEIAIYAKTLAGNGQLVTALKENDLSVLGEIAETNIINWNIDSLIILDADAKVVAKGEDEQSRGQSLSENNLVKRALAGKETASIETKEGALAPLVCIQAASPVLSKDKIIGVILASYAIDSAFLDGVKSATGLEVAIFGQNYLAASTILSPDGKSRWVGIKENQKEINERVLQKGEMFLLSKRMLNKPYMAAFAPLKNAENKIVGMVFVGKPEAVILTATAQSLSYTFILTAFLIILSVLPAYLLAKHFAYELR